MRPLPPASFSNWAFTRNGLLCPRSSGETYGFSMRFFITLVVVAALAGGGYFVWSKVPRSDARDNSAIKSAVVEARDISFAVNAAGDIGPADQVSVRPEVNGRIAELPVDIGDKVKKGDLLCRLDDKDLQIE